MTLQQEKAQRLHDALRQQLGGAILGYLADPDITDIEVNPDGRVWLHSHEHGRMATSQSLLPQETETILVTIAGMLGQELTADNPTLSGELPLDGNRVEGVIPPASFAPLLAIRKRPAKVYSLDDYVADDILTSDQLQVLECAIADERNFLVAGGTGSGKTTFANALLAAIVEFFPPSTRAVIIEDTTELQCTAPNRVPLHSSSARNTRQLLHSSLRLNPDLIVIGEVRGAEAYDLIKAWNTGHPGNVATLHANTAESALSRLDHLAQEADVPSQKYAIAAARLVLINIQGRTRRDRRVRDILAVNGLDYAGQYRLEFLAGSPSNERRAHHAHA